MILIFVSYSHKDSQYLQKDELIPYLEKGLKGKAKFWDDTDIATGEIWDEKIHKQILNSQIAILLLSENFIRSRYINRKEVKKFLTATIKKFVVFPVIVSPCDPGKIKWLTSKQYKPSGGRSIESDYPPGKERKAFYKELLKDIRKQIVYLKKPAISAGQALSGMINLVNTIETELLTVCKKEELIGNKHKLMFEGGSTALYADTRKIYGKPDLKIIRFNELKKKLPAVAFGKIKQLDRLLTNSYSKWFALDALISHLNTAKKNKSIQAEKYKIIFGMFTALIELLNYLRKIGFDLHDHYEKIYQAMGMEGSKAMNSY